MSQRLSVFKAVKNEVGYVQAVISDADLAEFKSLGFVTDVADLPKPKENKAGNDGKATE